MKVLIVSGGEKPSKELLKKVTKDCNLIIGVDHGCDVLAEQGIIPSYIVGDFDSADGGTFDFPAAGRQAAHRAQGPHYAPARRGHANHARRA